MQWRMVRQASSMIFNFSLCGRFAKSEGDDEDVVDEDEVDGFVTVISCFSKFSSSIVVVVVYGGANSSSSSSSS